jgi:branched-chain amino acid transport system substrate-binding protein
VRVCKGGPFTFRNLYRDDYQGDQIALYLKHKLGIEKAAVLFENDDYGKGLMQSFKARAEKEGLEIVAEVDYLRERTQDFKPLVQQAKDAGAQAIFVAGLYNEAALIAKSARQDHKMTVPIIGGDGVMNQDFVKIAGKASEGAYVTTPFLFNTGDDSEAATSFLAAFKKAYSKEPDTWAALTYDAMGMALEAVEKAGIDRGGVRDALAAAKDEASGYTGVTGVTYFDDEGDCFSKPVYMAVVKDGKFVPAEKQMQ